MLGVLYRKMKMTTVVILWLLACLHSAAAIVDPFTLGGMAGITLTVSAMYAGWDKLVCHFTECCSPPHINFRTSELSDTLRRLVHGQPLIDKVLVRAVNAHTKMGAKSSKALVISFHGTPGTGKNHVSKLLAESLYSSGMDSQYVHLFTVTRHFPHPRLAPDYQDDIRRWIHGNLSACPQSLFIFDEIDKMPVGIIDGIKPFIDYIPKISGVTTNRAIFVLLSNTGGRAITGLIHDFWKRGLDRKHITLNDVNKLISKDAFNAEGGLYHAEVIAKSLVDYYLPFLPLEREHVRLCAWDEFKRQNYTPTSEMIDRVANELDYVPDSTHIFSEFGCKRVAQKVAYIIEESVFH